MEGFIVVYVCAGDMYAGCCRQDGVGEGNLC